MLALNLPRRVGFTEPSRDVVSTEIRVTFSKLGGSGGVGQVSMLRGQCYSYPRMFQHMGTSLHLLESS